MTTLDDGRELALIREAISHVVEVDGSTRLDPSTVDLETSLDEMGLDSVLSMEVIGHLEERLGREFPDDQLSRIRTVGDLAALIRGSGR